MESFVADVMDGAESIEAKKKSLQRFSLPWLSKDIADFVTLLVTNDLNFGDDLTALADILNTKLENADFAFSTTLLEIASRLSDVFSDSEVIQKSKVNIALHILSLDNKLADEFTEDWLLRPLVRLLIGHRASEPFYARILEGILKLFSGQCSVKSIQQLLSRLRLLIQRRVSGATSQWEVTQLQQSMVNWVAVCRPKLMSSARSKDVESLLSSMLSDIMNCF
jgi:hypothetical protein